MWYTLTLTHCYTPQGLPQYQQQPFPQQGLVQVQQQPQVSMTWEDILIVFVQVQEAFRRPPDPRELLGLSRSFGPGVEVAKTGSGKTLAFLLLAYKKVGN